MTNEQQKMYIMLEAMYMECVDLLVHKYGYTEEQILEMLDNE
jgi:hypothetical protein